jgi:hypothetical protein
METTIHRWDAEEAHGIAHPIDDDLARDGIDEMLMLFREDPAYDENKDRRHGQRILLCEEPSGYPGPTGQPPHLGPEGRIPSCWLVVFDHAGITTSSDDGAADVTVTGSAADLWLYILGRRSPEEMDIEGDKELAASWGDLAGRF